MISFKNSNKKRGQAVNQVFIYMTASIIFGMVLLFGYSAVQNFLEDSEYVALISLKTNLESSINNIASTQDRENKLFRVPGGYEKICFIDMTSAVDPDTNAPTTMYTDLCGIGNNGLPSIVCNAWKDNVSQSIMLVNPLSQISINTVRIQVLNDSGDNVGAHCIDITRSVIKLQLKGLSNRAEIRPAIQ